MKRKNYDDRFEIVSEQSVGFSRTVTVLLDRKTGVNYLYFQSGYSGGLTPLLDRDGRPIISSVYSGLSQD